MKIFSIKKIFAAGAVCALSAALLVGCGGGGGSATGDKKFLNIGTGGTAGTYYPIGGAIAEILNKEIPGMNASAQSTGASVANINMLRDVQARLVRIREAYGKPEFTEEEKKRMRFAIDLHEKNIERLKALIERAKVSGTPAEIVKN